MDNTQFMQDSWDFLSSTMDMAEKKGVEYANGGDRLGNFKRAASELDLDPKVVAGVYFKKHVDSIMRYIKTNDRASLTEAFSGRIADAIVYLLIIKAIDDEQSIIQEIEAALALNKQQELDETFTDVACSECDPVREIAQ